MTQEQIQALVAAAQAAALKASPGTGEFWLALLSTIPAVAAAFIPAASPWLAVVSPAVGLIVYYIRTAHKQNVLAQSLDAAQNAAEGIAAAPPPDAPPGAPGPPRPARGPFGQALPALLAGLCLALGAQACRGGAPVAQDVAQAAQKLDTACGWFKAAAKACDDFNLGVGTTAPAAPPGVPAP